MLRVWLHAAPGGASLSLDDSVLPLGRHKKAGPPFLATRLSQLPETRGFPSPPRDGFGFVCYIYYCKIYSIILECTIFYKIRNNIVPLFPEGLRQIFDFSPASFNL